MKSRLSVCHRMYRFAFLLSLILSSSFTSASASSDYFRDAVEPSIEELLDSETTEGGIDLEFCHEGKFAPLCLQMLMTLRCNQYGFPIPGAALGCGSSAKLAVKLLDLRQVDTIIQNDDGTESVFKTKLIFATRLEKLIADSHSKNYLFQVRNALEEAYANKIPFNLYEFTLKVANGNLFQALEWLGVFFQDTTFTIIPVKYLEQKIKEGKLNANTQEAIDQLRVILALLKPKFLAQQSYKKWVTLYPTQYGKNLNQDMNPTMYHFYPMAYWTASLQSAKVSTRWAFFLPFLFNADYEFQTMDEERWPLKHPRPFELNELTRHQTRDIYAGLAGALLGAGMQSSLPELDTFYIGFSRNPFGEMQRWFYHSFFFTLF